MQRAILREMRTAPLDGTAVEVRHGPLQMMAVARWSGQDQAWIRADDRIDDRCIGLRAGGRWL